MTQDSVTLTKEQYESLLGRLEKVESGKKEPVRTKREEHHTATIMLFDNKPVVFFENIKTKEKVSEDGSIEMVTSNKITIHVKDGDKIDKREVNYKSLIENAVRVRAEIVEMDKKTVVKPQGIQPQRIWTVPEDPANVSGNFKNWHSEQVDLEHTEMKIVVKVKIVEGSLTGTILTLDSGVLNK